MSPGEHFSLSVRRTGMAIGTSGFKAVVAASCCVSVSATPSPLTSVLSKLAQSMKLYQTSVPGPRGAAPAFTGSFAVAGP